MVEFYGKVTGHFSLPLAVVSLTLCPPVSPSSVGLWGVSGTAPASALSCGEAMGQPSWQLSAPVNLLKGNNACSDKCLQGRLYTLLFHSVSCF